MVEIRIGETSRSFNDYRESWIHNQIKRRRKDGINPCVKVRINEGSVNLSLITSNCPGSRASSSNFDKQMREIIALWNKHIKGEDYTSGQIIAFLKQLHRYL